MAKLPTPAPWTSSAAAKHSRLVRAATLLFFGPIALYVLHIAKESVPIGFTVALITIAVFALVTAVMGGKEIFSRIFQTPEDK